jgi:hypothetical protein
MTRKFYSILLHYKEVGNARNNISPKWPHSLSNITKAFNLVYFPSLRLLQNIIEIKSIIRMM